MSTIPIITPPPKKDPQPQPQGKATVVPQGVVPPKMAIKHYTTWLWAILLASPDGLYQGAAAIGLLSDEAMPESVKWFIRAVAGVGFVAKFVSQQKPA